MQSNHRPLGNGSQSHFEFHVGGLHVIIRPPLVHLALSPSKAVRHSLGPPQLFKGKRAQHLTIPLEPLRHGPNAGKINVHLTTGDGERRTIAMLDPAAIDAAFARFASALRHYGVSNRRHFPLEELRDAGFRVVLPKQNLERVFNEHIDRKRFVLRLNNERIERALVEFEIGDLDILDRLRDAKHVTLTDEQGRALIVGYWPTGDGTGSPPGWYGLPIDRGANEVMDEFLASLGPAFCDAMITVARELQADMDLYVIESCEPVRRPSRRRRFRRNPSELSDFSGMILVAVAGRTSCRSCRAAATMHRVKSFELDYVIVAGANADLWPFAPAFARASDDVAREDWEHRERTRFYLARMRRKVLVACYGKPSSWPIPRRI